MSGLRATRIAGPGLALVLASTPILACTPARAPGDPTPLAVNPSRSPGTAPVQVEISGKDLDAHVRTDYASPAGDRLDARFAAQLEPASGAPVPLSDVRLTGRRTLLATVPGGIAPGSYRLVVRDPAGRTGTLERAYRVVSSPDSAVRFEVTVLGPARAGVAFPISIVAVDAGGAVVDGFDGPAAVSDTAGALAAAPAGPFVLGRYGGTVTVPRLVTGDALVATDAGGRSGTSAPFDVVAGPAMALVFPSPPVAAAQGRCSPRVDLALRDALGHPATAAADVVVELHSSPPGLELFEDAGCTVPAASIALRAGRGAAAFHFRAESAGTVAVRAAPASLPSVTQVLTVTPEAAP